MTWRVGAIVFSQRNLMLRSPFGQIQSERPDVHQVQRPLPLLLNPIVCEKGIPLKLYDFRAPTHPAPRKKRRISDAITICRVPG